MGNLREAKRLGNVPGLFRSPASKMRRIKMADAKLTEIASGTWSWGLGAVKRKSVNKYRGNINISKIILCKRTNSYCDNSIKL